ncbi:erythroid transcription factor [Lates japonicus]|uniref:Erythroid transcription factor n=1 Tax=Lates japonicus TaxID=270547 RepID=A0AAD3NAT6_LATJO|nr:erythroid transcription factor [Lates japonicus]
MTTRPETSRFNMKVSPAPAHALLQSPVTSHNVSQQVISPCHWLDDSLSSAYVSPPPSSSLYGNPALTTPPTCLISSTPGWNSYYGNLYPMLSGDWVLPGGQSWGRDDLPGETPPQSSPVQHLQPPAENQQQTTAEAKEEDYCESGSENCVNRPLTMKKDGIQTRNRRVTNKNRKSRRADQSETKQSRLVPPPEEVTCHSFTQLLPCTLCTSSSWLC